MFELSVLLPEASLVVTLGCLIIAEMTYHGERIRLHSTIALIGLFTAIIQIVLLSDDPVGAQLGGAVVLDGASIFLKLFAVVLCFLTLLISISTREIYREGRTEYYSFLIAGALSMCFAISAVDVLTLYISLQVFNITVFLIAGYSKKNILSTEAAIKYLGFSTLSSALFGFAFALLFYHTETLKLYEMQTIFGSLSLSDGTVTIIFLLLFLGVCFYLASFPFHFWLPDVLQGSPTSSSAFLSLAVPVVGLAVAIRLYITLTGNVEFSGSYSWNEVAAFCSGLTMLIGALLAVRQSSAKRLICSLILGHLGFLAMGLTVVNKNGLPALFYNLVIDLFSLTGMFLGFSILYDAAKSERLDEIKKVVPFAIPECICLLIFLGSYLGVPPLPGFVGRFALVGAVVQSNWNILAMMSVLSGVISIAAFTRFSLSLADGLKVSSLGEERYELDSKRRLTLLCVLVPFILVFFFSDALFLVIEHSVKNILW